MAEPYQRLVFCVAIAVVAIGAVLDWRKGAIPYWLTRSALVAAPFLHVARFAMAKAPLDASLHEGAYSLGGAALCAAGPLLLFRQNAIGGGDVALFAAMGALLQPALGLEAEVYGFFAAALLAPVRLAYEGKLLGAARNAWSIGANLFLPTSRQRSVDSTALSWFRLGPPVFLGVLLTVYLHW